MGRALPRGDAPQRGLRHLRRRRSLRRRAGGGLRGAQGLGDEQHREKVRRYISAGAKAGRVEQ
jgi:hypothetical protein|uniref:Uncharacterized protein n=1 Tax=Oryza sativa subsp. japonica TaxID=39947 RepID=Q6ATY9_ORYSJ|nr:unknown protein [Oryza sativa Japonica Group]